jgi:hypothetical protein
MIFNADNKLDVFENFQTDRNLPKFQSPDNEGEELMGSSDSSSLVFTGRHRGGVTLTSNFAVNSGSVEPKHWYSWFTRLFKKRPPKPTMTIEQVFTSLKNNVAELEIVAERAAGYAAAMQRARESGQTALLEQLEQGLGAARGEAQLVAMGLGKYLDEAQVVVFVKQAKKGLRLDWIANFTRVVPTTLIALKMQADQRGVFDNYVILHYDPKKKSWAETNAEKARRKDPILFGVMEGKRRLYYVGDWVDELCDLTLDGVADVLGKESIHSLKESV